MRGEPTRFACKNHCLFRLFHMVVDLRQTHYTTRIATCPNSDGLPSFIRLLALMLIKQELTIVFSILSLFRFHFNRSFEKGLSLIRQLSGLKQICNLDKRQRLFGTSFDNLLPNATRLGLGFFDFTIGIEQNRFAPVS